MLNLTLKILDLTEEEEEGLKRLSQRLGDFSPGGSFAINCQPLALVASCWSKQHQTEKSAALGKTQKPLSGVQGGRDPGNNLGQGGRLCYCSLFA